MVPVASRSPNGNACRAFWVRYAGESGSLPASCVVLLVEERKLTSVLLGWLGPQEDGKLVFQPRVVEVEKLVASGGVGLRGMQL
jgi:hypothetical protein